MFTHVIWYLKDMYTILWDMITSLKNITSNQSSCFHTKHHVGKVNWTFLWGRGLFFWGFFQCPHLLRLLLLLQRLHFRLMESTETLSEWDNNSSVIWPIFFFSLFLSFSFGQSCPRRQQTSTWLQQGSVFTWREHALQSGQYASYTENEHDATDSAMTHF